MHNYRCFSHILISLTLLMGSHNLYAQDSHHRQAVSIDYLDGSSNLQGTRLAYRPYTTDVFEIPIIGQSRLYWEASVNFWKTENNFFDDASWALALSPVFVKKLTDIDQRYPLFLEFGIGVSYVHDEKFAGRDIGSNYQFEDRIGFILGLDKENRNQVFIRYMHYSNGGFNTKNPGLDFLSLGYSYHF
uniref:acyloxyacyl hydrolase n=1 Tax=Ningiella ruwaisensis TaxID=2364274 RepID=UPI00109F3E58|nr:acyloxyacyl hydrolase [Ningiella ruwaisensis]